MQKYLLFIGCLFIIFSCKDDNEIENISFLTKHTWKLEQMKFTISVFTLDAMKVANTDEKPTVYLNFYQNNTYKAIDTAGVLVFNGLIQENGTWEFNNDTTIIYLNKNKIGNLDLQIDVLSDNDFQCRTTVITDSLDFTGLSQTHKKIAESVKTSEVSFDFIPEK